VKEPPSRELHANEALKSVRLAEALTLLAKEHAAQHHLSEAAVVGAFCWVVGGIVGACASVMAARISSIPRQGQSVRIIMTHIAQS